MANTLIQKHEKMASKQNEVVRKRYTTQYSQVDYKHGQIRMLNYFIYALIWIYFILSVVYLWMIFVSKSSSEYTFRYKMFVLVGLLLFPYIITPLEMFFMRMITFVVETVVGNVYTRPDYDYVIDRSYVPTLFSY